MKKLKEQKDNKKIIKANTDDEILTFKSVADLQKYIKDNYNELVEDKIETN